MSIRVMADVWPLDLPASEKLVLLALADAANDDRECWPSVAGKRPLTTKTSLSERTVQNAIKSLCLKGHLSRRERQSRGVIYTVHPRSSCTPANAASVQMAAPTPATAAPKTSVTINHNILEVQATDKPVVGGTKWHRLPADWHPSTLPSELRDRQAAWPLGWEPDQLEQFRAWAFNAADQNGKGRKLDWNHAWQNWLRRSENEIGFRKHNGTHRNQVARRSGDDRTQLARRLIQEAQDYGD